MHCLDKSEYINSDIDRATHIAFAGEYYELGRAIGTGYCAAKIDRRWNLYYNNELVLSVRLDRLAAANGCLVREKKPVKLQAFLAKHGKTTLFPEVVEVYIPYGYAEQHDTFRVTIEGL